MKHCYLFFNYYHALLSSILHNHYYTAIVITQVGGMEYYILIPTAHSITKTHALTVSYVCSEV